MKTTTQSSFTHRMKKLTLPIAALLLAFSGYATAAPLVYEGFGYAPGALAGQNGGIGWETPWDTTTPAVSGTNSNLAAVTSVSLSYGALVKTGGDVFLNHSVSFPTVEIFRDLNGTLGGAGSDLWMSFLIDARIDGSSFLSLRNSVVSGGGALVSLGAGISFTPAGYGVIYTGGAGAPVAGGVLQALGVNRDTGTHFMVIRLNMNTGGLPAYTTWIDPSPASLGVGSVPTGGTSVVLNTGTQAFGFDRISIVRAVQIGFVDPVPFDEIRIGTTWVDVSPIPEPATGMMLVAGLGMLTCIRRRTVRA